jgi:hypothetical protein
VQDSNGEANLAITPLMCEIRGVSMRWPKYIINNPEWSGREPVG